MITQNFFQWLLLHDLTMNYLKMKFLVYLMVQMNLYNFNSEKDNVLWRKQWGRLWQNLHIANSYQNMQHSISFVAIP